MNRFSFRIDEAIGPCMRRNYFLKLKHHRTFRLFISLFILNKHSNGYLLRICPFRRHFQMLRRHNIKHVEVESHSRSKCEDVVGVFVYSSIFGSASNALSNVCAKIWHFWPRTEFVWMTFMAKQWRCSDKCAVKIHARWHIQSNIRNE